MRRVQKGTDAGEWKAALVRLQSVRAVLHEQRAEQSDRGQACERFHFTVSQAQPMISITKTMINRNRHDKSSSRYGFVGAAWLEVKP